MYDHIMCVCVYRGYYFRNYTLTTHSCSLIFNVCLWEVARVPELTIGKCSSINGGGEAGGCSSMCLIVRTGSCGSIDGLVSSEFGEKKPVEHVPFV